MCMPLLIHALGAVLLPLPNKCAALHASLSQDKRVPLHHAAATGAPVDVMKLLLEAEPQTATAVAQARAALSTCTQTPHADGPAAARLTT